MTLTNVIPILELKTWQCCLPNDVSCPCHNFIVLGVRDWRRNRQLDEG